MPRGGSSAGSRGRDAFRGTVETNQPVVPLGVLKSRSPHGVTLSAAHCELAAGPRHAVGPLQAPSVQPPACLAWREGGDLQFENPRGPVGFYPTGLPFRRP